MQDSSESSPRLTRRAGSSKLFHGVAGVAVVLYWGAGTYIVRDPKAVSGLVGYRFDFPGNGARDAPAEDRTLYLSIFNSIVYSAGWID